MISFDLAICTRSSTDETWSWSIDCQSGPAHRPDPGDPSPPDCGVREPLRPLPPTLSAGAALDLPA